MQRKVSTPRTQIDGRRSKIAIVVSKFNSDITGGMLKGALDVLKKNKVKDKNVKIVWVPGSLEIPLVCLRLSRTKKYDGLVVIGCVIKGGTDHYYYVAGESIRGVMNVMLETGVPIGMGIITTNNLKQAKERSGAKNNKGAEAAQAMLEMILLSKKYYK
jgi:6,7-dimethyl-8-ribityllumazine synthase